MKIKIKEIVELLDLGINFSLKFNNNYTDDWGTEYRLNNQTYKIINYGTDIDDNGDIEAVIIRFLDGDNINFLIDDEIDIDIVDNDVFAEYLKNKENISYAKWLENRVIYLQEELRHEWEAQAGAAL